MRDLMMEEVSSVSGGRGMGWVTIYKDSTDGDSGSYTGGQCMAGSIGVTPLTNKILDVCNNAGAKPYDSEASVTVTYAQIGTLSVLGSGTSAVNTVSITSNCGKEKSSSR